MIQPPLEEIQIVASKAGLMMIDVNRRISQWDQQRILSSVEVGTGKTQIVSGHRPSKSVRGESVADEEVRRSSALPGAAGVLGTAPADAAASEPG